MNITLRHFEIVDAVVKCQSITRAAALLEMTQPGLTRAIKALEDQIGKDLFIRTPRGLDPTDAASIILKRYTKIASGPGGHRQRNRANQKPEREQVEPCHGNNG
jgi:DNA-binding transcriptional LysR family regulator